MSEVKPKITKKKLQELANLWGFTCEWRNVKRSQWTDRQEESFDQRQADLEKECEAAGIFDENNNIREDLLPAYRKGIRSAHKL